MRWFQSWQSWCYLACEKGALLYIVVGLYVVVVVHNFLDVVVVWNAVHATRMLLFATLKLCSVCDYVD